MASRFTVIEKLITGSTNTDALAMAREGAAAFTVVWAREQTAARGRFDRRWIADPGNLYWSVIVRPRRPQSETVVFVAAMSIFDAVRPLLPAERRLEIKWPNDALIDDAKFSGTLVEKEGDALVVGIGINVSIAPGAGQTLYPATSLHQSGASGTSVDDVCARLQESFAYWYDVWEREGMTPTVRRHYLERMWRLGGPVSVSLDAAKSETVEGTNRGINESGHLLLEREGSRDLATIVTGDVLFGR